MSNQATSRDPTSRNQKSENSMPRLPLLQNKSTPNVNSSERNKSKQITSDNYEEDDEDNAGFDVVGMI